MPLSALYCGMPHPQHLNGHAVLYGAAGFGHQTLSSGTERIADHLINLGKSILRLGLIANFESQLAKK